MVAEPFQALATSGREAIEGLPRWARLGLVAAFALACGLVAPRGGIVAILWIAVGALLILRMADAAAEPQDRKWLVGIALLALVARDALVGAVDVALLATTGATTYAPDEVTYLRAAASLARHWHDPAAPFDATNLYLPSQYVQIMAGIFYLFGQNLVLVKLFNTFLGIASALLLYRSARNLSLPGARLASALLLVFPSIAFWSALGLKDAYVIFFLLASLWTSSEFIRTRRPIWILATALIMLPIESVRNYIFVIDAIAWLAIVLAVGGLRARVVTGAAVSAAVLALFVVTQPFADFGPNPFYIPILTRNINAAAARSAFLTAAPVVNGNAGDRFVVFVGGATAAPGTTPRVVVVQPGDQIVVLSPAPAGASGLTPQSLPSGQVGVRPGDIVVIAGTPAPTPTPVAGGTAAPPATPRALELQAALRSTVGSGEAPEDQSNSIGGSLKANLEALPRGLLFSLFAPFPWSAPQTIEQAATIPEMIGWYACLLLAAVGTGALLWRRDLRYAHGLAAAAGLLIILALIEANLGTLVRSRAMLVPYVLVLAGVGLEELRLFRQRRAAAPLPPP